MHFKYLHSAVVLAAMVAAAPLNSEKRATEGWYCVMMETNNVKGTVTLQPDATGGSAISGYSWSFGHSLQIQPPSGGYVQSWEDDSAGNRNIDTSTTHLRAPVVWEASVSLDSCSVTYNQQTTPGVMTTAGGSYGPFYSDSTTFCAVTFACDPPTVTTGWCGVHVEQRRGEENPGYVVEVKDASGFAIGNAGNWPAAGTTLSVGTLLEHSLDIISDADGDAPVRFSYNGASWDSSSPSCSVGAYNGLDARQMDCGFTC